MKTKWKSIINFNAIFRCFVSTCLSLPSTDGFHYADDAVLNKDRSDSFDSEDHLNDFVAFSFIRNWNAPDSTALDTNQNSFFSNFNVCVLVVASVPNVDDYQFAKFVLVWKIVYPFGKRNERVPVPIFFIVAGKLKTQTNK